MSEMATGSSEKNSENRECVLIGWRARFEGEPTVNVYGIEWWSLLIEAERALAV